MLIQNAIITPDGTFLSSSHVHDYVTHEDVNGEQYMLDGGTDYIRRNLNTDAVDLSVTTDMPFSEQREKLVWGTYGINGDQPLSHVKLKDMDTGHIKAVIDTQNISPQRRKVMEEELCGRNS